ncbi:hypothetical protein B0H14DRAFT_2619017 [Mycena olivaceomarginata]|nr:hypothetical protein B0H14DRAFT_2619017 [Mycena olivaceomarginata]
MLMYHLLFSGPPKFSSISTCWLIASKFHHPLCFQCPSDSLLFWVQYQIMLKESGQSLGNQLQTHGWTGSQVSVYLAHFMLDEALCMLELQLEQEVDTETYAFILPFFPGLEASGAVSRTEGGVTGCIAIGGM